MTFSFPTSCVGGTLPVPDGHWASLHDADPTGRYLVGAVAVQPNTLVAIWDGGSVTVVDPPGEAVVGDLAVNSEGEVAGSTLGPSGGSAWIHRDGRFTALPGPQNVTVTAINSLGDVLGSTAEGPIVWRQGRAAEALPLPSGATSVIAKAIDDDGTVIGYRLDGAAATPLLWTADWPVRQLPVPTGMDKYVTAIGVRDGRVIGVSGRRQDPSQPHDTGLGILWDLRTGTASALPGDMARATDINRSGWLAGFTETGEGAISEGPSGRLLRLPPPVDAPAAEWADAFTTVTISDNAKVVTADMTDGPDRLVAVRWICT